MLLFHLGVPLTLTNAPLFVVQSNRGSLQCAGSPNFVTHLHRQRRTRSPRSSPHAPRLHPVDSAPEGVPSSLFTFRPNSPYARNTENDGDGDGEGGGGDDTTATAATTAAVAAAETLHSGLVEESDLGDVSELLVEVRTGGASSSSSSSSSSRSSSSSSSSSSGGGSAALMCRTKCVVEEVALTKDLAAPPRRSQRLLLVSYYVRVRTNRSYCMYPQSVQYAPVAFGCLISASAPTAPFRPNAAAAAAAPRS